MEAESCYQAKYGTSAVGPKIDDGGMRVSGRLAPRHNLHGTKWGAGTSFLTTGDNLDADGPRIGGGEVTYSFMGGGVSIGTDGGSGVSCSPTCTNTSIFSFVETDSGGDTHFADCFTAAVEAAFAAWSAVTDITFVPVTDSGAAFDAAGASGDIRIGFHPFDGASGVLAHAFFPPPNGTSAAGDLHFDVAEPWSCSPLAGSFDIGIVALHEIGHSIGLRHEPTEIAVMNASYNAALTFGPLADDIIGAGQIYGEAGAATTAFFGDIGVGTDTPNASLHVVRDDGSAAIRVEDTASPAAVRTMLDMVNNGNAKLLMTNSGSGTSWGFNAAGSGYRISRQGSGVVEFQVLNNGDVVVEGDVTAQSFIPVSDRNRKTNFQPVDPIEVLNKVASLPISFWSFKGETGAVHLGPMAQDFHALFGLGDRSTAINVLDSDGVALAAIQGLYQVIQERDQAIRDLSAELEALRQIVHEIQEQK